MKSSDHETRARYRKPRDCIRCSERFLPERAEHICPLCKAVAAPPQRPCMCCGRPFKSEGAHNRLCDGCRTRAGRMAAML